MKPGLIALFCLIPMLGCAGTLEPRTIVHRDGSTTVSYTTAEDLIAATPAECAQYDSAYAAWGGVAAGTAALSGLSGLATALPDDKNAKLALGLGTLVIGGVSATSVYLSQHYATRYTERCAVKTE